MTDAIIEAAARALRSASAWTISAESASAYAEVVLTTVTPLIEATALERAAKAIETEEEDYLMRGEVVAAIRALIPKDTKPKDGPQFEGMWDEVKRLMSVLTPEDVAERWKCSPSHVRRLIANGKLGHFRLGGKLLRIPESAVEAFECPPTSSNDSAADGLSPHTSTENASRAVSFLRLAQAKRPGNSSASSANSRSPRE
jgi:excisionase family DNA binding protein